MARASASTLVSALPARLGADPRAGELLQAFFTRATSENEALASRLEADALGFTRMLSRALSEAPLLAPALAQLHAGDLLLAFACAQGDVEAIRLLEQRMDAQGFFQRLSSERLPAADLRQLVRERLFVTGANPRPRIAEYSGRGSLLAWLKVVVARVLLNELRRHERELPVDDRELLAHVERGGQQPARLRAHNPHVQEAFLAAWQSVSSKDRNLMRQRFLDALSLPQLAQLYHVDRATISRWLLDTRRRLMAATREQLAARLGGATSSELDDLLESVEKDLAVSLRALQITPAAT